LKSRSKVKAQGSKFKAKLGPFRCLPAGAQFFLTAGLIQQHLVIPVPIDTPFLIYYTLTKKWLLICEVKEAQKEDENA
jgi:hypothetical protein